MQIGSQDASLVTAVAWIQSILLGAVGTSLAILGLAVLGLSMLQGRIAWRDAARVVIGIFILFGAPVIAKGLIDIASVSYAFPPRVEDLQRSPVLPEMPTPPPSNPDPYAGAAMPG